MVSDSGLMVPGRINGDVVASSSVRRRRGLYVRPPKSSRSKGSRVLAIGADERRSLRGGPGVA